jgi:L,D-peptidoglycan transpeptidase YkuD (ErfK/YbiS/YcfS/YnhG family)
VTDIVVGRWGARFGNRHIPCAIGRGGLRADKREGDGATPVGRFALRRAYFRPDRMARPRMPLALAPIGPRLGWSDDPRDPGYNRACRWPHGYSAERVRRGDGLYDVVVVTAHNEDGVAGKGSAVFIHVRRGLGPRTAGCIAFRRDHLLWLLRRIGRGALDVRSA